MMHMQLVRALVMMLLLVSCLAGNVGRQRRVQTAATSTGSSQVDGLGLPLWHATYATNDEYIEKPFRRPQNERYLQQQQPKSFFTSQMNAEESEGVADQSQENSRHATFEPEFVDILPAADVTPARLQELLLFNAPQSLQSPQSPSAEIIHRNNHGEARFGHKNTKVVLVTIATTTPATTTTTTTTTTPAPAGAAAAASPAVNLTINNVVNGTTPADTTTGTRVADLGLTRAPQYFPMQYFPTRQGLEGLNGLQLPYNLIDMNHAGLYRAGGISSIGGIAGAGAGFGTGYGTGFGAGVPLVPITVGNNAVAYVPLNLRMFRQLVDGIGFGTGTSTGAGATVASLPIRESEDITPAFEPEEEQESNDAGEEATPEKVTSSRFQLFGQRVRQRPVIAPETYGMRNPLMAFANNIRRMQYL